MIRNVIRAVIGWKPLITRSKLYFANIPPVGQWTPRWASQLDTDAQLSRRSCAITNSTTTVAFLHQDHQIMLVRELLLNDSSSTGTLSEEQQRKLDFLNARSVTERLGWSDICCCDSLKATCVETLETLLVNEKVFPSFTSVCSLPMRGSRKHFRR